MAAFRADSAVGDVVLESDSRILSLACKLGNDTNLFAGLFELSFERGALDLCFG